jgi:hypothetical protein
MIKEFFPDDPEVTKLRIKIFTEDLNLSPEDLQTFDDPNTNNKFAYWYCDKKFLSNKFDRVLLHYYNDEAIGMAGGTYFNKDLYRCLQMIYILKRARRIDELNTLHFKDNGFFDYHIGRAKNLGCRGLFYSVDPYDKRHIIMYDYLRKNKSSMAHMPMAQRKYNASHFLFLDKEYEINYTKQKIAFFPFDKSDNFDSLFYGT